MLKTGPPYFRPIRKPFSRRPPLNSLPFIASKQFSMAHSLSQWSTSMRASLTLEYGAIPFLASYATIFSVPQRRIYSLRSLNGPSASDATSSRWQAPINVPHLCLSAYKITRIRRSFSTVATTSPKNSPPQEPPYTNWDDAPRLKEWITKEQGLTLDTLNIYGAGLVERGNVEHLPKDDVNAASLFSNFLLAAPEYSPSDSFLQSFAKSPHIHIHHRLPRDLEIANSSLSSASSSSVSSSPTASTSLPSLLFAAHQREYIDLSNFHLAAIRYRQLRRSNIEAIDTMTSYPGLFGCRTLYPASYFRFDFMQPALVNPQKEEHVSVHPASLVITADEMDAMILHQVCKLPSICLPRNAPQLPPALLPIFSLYKRIYVWLDHRNKYSSLCYDRLAAQLGRGRVRIINQSTDSGLIVTPRLAFHKNLHMEKLLLSAPELENAQVLMFDVYRKSVEDEFAHPDKVLGIQSKTLPGLNRILKGFRRGELTIFSGPTGSGKTSVLSQLSLDYCCQGVGTLWGSFEIPNNRLIKKMIRQFANKDFSLDVRDYDMWANRFKKLRMYFMNFFGSSTLEEVMEVMHYSVDAKDVSHIVLDNLQFMLSGQERGNFDKYDLMDRTISCLRNFCHQKNVHITLVIHPRKEPDEMLLGIASISGSAKATQEADNIIILQKISDKKRYLDIKKNRFDGETGRIPFLYDPVSGKIYEEKMLEEPDEQEVVTEETASEEEEQSAVI